ncbi:MAG: lipopolysaccharide transport periplasmic protein LptA [Rhodocyclales bacterium]|nr:lipopolysaccharide transport periplasmic protein LptA [Rhodocyclales bacterium]
MSMQNSRILIGLSLSAIASTLIGAAAALHSASAQAERADREKPVRIQADFAPVDDKTKTVTLEGHVKITQGTLVILANKAIVTQDADGFQTAVAISGEGNLARLQQKREGKNEMVYAEGERIEYDARTEKAKLIKRAWIRMGVGNEACADNIEYNAQNETYQATRSGTKPGDQVEIVLPGKAAQSAPAVAITCERKK